MAKFDMKVRSELVAAKFNNYLQELWAIDPTVEFSTLVKSEAAAVLAVAMTRTRGASTEKIRARVREREWVTFDGQRYKINYGRTEGPGWHLPDALWNRIEQYRHNLLEVKLAARGMGKQSFYLLAKQLRPALMNVPAYVIGANYRGRQYPQDVSSMDGATPAGYILTVLNASPIVQHAGGEWALLGAMQGRVSYFRQNMQHRAFETYESRARKYPGIWVQEGAAA